MLKKIILSTLLFLTLPLTCLAIWNKPHVTKPHEKVLHGAFASAPKTLDPARAYSSDELQFIAQIYEPPLQYHYLKRPFVLTPLTLAEPLAITYLDKNKKTLSKNTPNKAVAYSVYTLTFKSNIRYQPHPAFAKNKAGKYRYLNLSLKDLKAVKDLQSFKYTGTRNLQAADYAYEIKRLATPAIHSPIYGVMQQYILGFKDFKKELPKHPKGFLDLRKYPLTGVKVLNSNHLQITIKGKYPQFRYWLAMSFFSPIPWEADQFYSQPGMKDKNLSFAWQPVGTGPYYLAENNPNKQMVLKRNPNFWGEKFPATGEATDKANGYLALSGQTMPFIDKYIFTLDKESIPRWNKFLQGYYDRSGISADSFDQAIKLNKKGKPVLSKDMKQKGITLKTTVNPSLFYIGFNMLDDIVGGNSIRAKKLRQAISIALDYEEYIQLFMNGRGIAAHGPIPPGLFGYEAGKNHVNDVVYFWQKGKAKRKPISEAKKLLKEAGYPNGIDPKTGKPLILHYDVTSTGSPDDKARFNWMRKQFAKIGIHLNIRHTEYNRFRDKVRTGQAQLFSWGWMADYPDPENFLFLLYSKNGKVKHGGENASNYHNEKFDKLYEQAKALPNGPERLAKIRRLMKIVQQDAPLIWGVHPIDFSLSHQWVSPTKPHPIANNTLKYQSIDHTLRQEKQKTWNKPVLWPLWVLLGFILVMFIPLTITYWRRENRPTVSRK